MKRDSKSRNIDTGLFLELDAALLIEDSRYWGLFYDEDKKKRTVKIDPRRYNKKIGLTSQQLEYMKKRKTHYFMPNKQNFYDYNINIFINEINEIKKDWATESKPIIDHAVSKIKAQKVTPGDDYNLMCGISGYGAANARANWNNMMAEQEANYKRYGLICSMYSQFFHQMASRIEAVTVKVLAKNGALKDGWFKRTVLYDTFVNKEEGVKLLDGFNAYDKLYCIWNFVKHNSKSTYDTLKDKYPELLQQVKYDQGELAIYYLVLDEKLILGLLEGTKIFFKNFCKENYKEDYDEAQWNYDKYFVSQVNNEIEGLTNPLGLDMFDDID